MSACCEGGCGEVRAAPMNAQARRLLWIVLAANAAMFGVEVIGGHAVGSLALQADALDFGADAATYAITLWAIGKSDTLRIRAALLKSASMLLVGLAILAGAALKIASGAAPDAPPMGLIGALALAVNLGAVILLLGFRQGDANLSSAWLCSRNDAVGNLLVIFAAILTAWTHSLWPDLVVGIVMCLLFLSGSWAVYRQARRESSVAAGSAA